MSRASCPEGQHHLFPEFEHTEQPKPLRPLPFRRNEEVDAVRAARILATDKRTILRMIKKELIVGYRYGRRSPYRISYQSLVQLCDAISLDPDFRVPIRSKVNGRRKDEDVLPFRAVDTITVQDVAEHLDISERGVLKLIEEGAFYSYQLLKERGVPWRIYKPSVDEYLEKIEQQCGAQKLKSSVRQERP